MADFLEEVAVTLACGALVLCMASAFLIMVCGGYLVTFVWTDSHLFASLVAAGALIYWLIDVRKTLEQTP
jgi:hypothetical protein